MQSTRLQLNVRSCVRVWAMGGDQTEERGQVRATSQGGRRRVKPRVRVARLESEVNELLVGCNVVGE